MLFEFLNNETCAIAAAWGGITLMGVMGLLMLIVIPDYRKFNPNNPPRFFVQLIRIVLGAIYKSSARKDMQLPRVQVDVKGMKIKNFIKTHKKFSEFCGYTKAGLEERLREASMGCFLEILSLPIQIAIISDPQFPLQAFGLIHVKNVIHQTRDIKLEEELNLRGYIEGQRWVDAGLEFDIALTAYEQDPEKPVWKCIATLISRSGRSGGRQPKGSSSENSKSSENPIEKSFESKWNLPQSTGLKYADISGDYNPHHLYPITAIPFGFPGPIAHGMYTLSRAIGEVVQSEIWKPEYPFTIAAEFKRPLILPAKDLSLKGQLLSAKTQIDSSSSEVCGLIPSIEERSNAKSVSAGVFSNKGVPHLKASFVTHL